MRKRRATSSSTGTQRVPVQQRKASAITNRTMMERRIVGNATDRLHYSRIFSAKRTLNIVLIAATPIKKIATVSKFARETCPA